MNETQLVARIKAHIERGDKANDKAQQHYIAAGQHLQTLKANHAGNWAEWQELLKTKIGIGKSRASELMQIAGGSKTVDEVRAVTAGRTRKSRESSPLRSGENAEDPEALVVERTNLSVKAESPRLVRNCRTSRARSSRTKRRTCSTSSRKS